MTEFHVGQWVRIARGSFAGTAGKIERESRTFSLSYDVRYSAGYGMFFADEVEPFVPRIGERCKLVKAPDGVNTDGVLGRPLQLAKRGTTWLGTSELVFQALDAATDFGSVVCTGPGFEFESVFDEAVQNLSEWHPRPGERVQTRSARRGVYLCFDEILGGHMVRLQRSAGAYELRGYELRDLQPVSDEAVKQNLQPSEETAPPTIRIERTTTGEVMRVPESVTFDDLVRLLSKPAPPGAWKLEDQAREECHAVAAELSRAPSEQAYTHGACRPRSEREARRKAMALEVLSGKWSGKR